MTLWMPDDIYFMRNALYLARTGLARTGPNPSVGCVIVKGGRVIARARTADGGRPHAETQALAIAGERAEGSTIYVTLEPCSHHGQTPPCVKAVIAAKPARVVIGMSDPDTRVSGRGIQALRDAGIEVVCGVLEDEVREVLAGYIMYRTENRPFVTLKIASTMDGKIATASGESQWITGELARRYGHLERSRHDMIAVGIGTVLGDNPRLSARIEGVQNDPVRLVFDAELLIPQDSELVLSADQTPTWVVCGDDVDSEKAEWLLSTSVDILKYPLNDKGIVALSTLLPELVQRGIQTMMVEGGRLLITEFLKAGICDRILWFRAPCIIGDTGFSGVADLEVERLVDKMDFVHNERRKLGNDILDVYTR